MAKLVTEKKYAGVLTYDMIREGWKITEPKTTKTMKTLNGNKTQKIPIGEIKDSYLLVNFDWNLNAAKRTEECHGTHEIDESDVEFDIIGISVWVGGVAIQSLGKTKLTPKMLSAIEEVLTIED